MIPQLIICSSFLAIAILLVRVSNVRYRKSEELNEKAKPEDVRQRLWVKVYDYENYEFFVICGLIAPYLVAYPLSWFMSWITGDPGVPHMLIPILQCFWYLMGCLAITDVFRAHWFSFKDLIARNRSVLHYQWVLIIGFMAEMAINTCLILNEPLVLESVFLSLFAFVPKLLFFILFVLFVLRRRQFSLWSEATQKNPDGRQSSGTFSSFGYAGASSAYGAYGTNGAVSSRGASAADLKNPYPPGEYPPLHLTGTTHFEDTTDPDWLDSGDEDDCFGFSSSSSSSSSSASPSSYGSYRPQQPSHPLWQAPNPPRQAPARKRQTRLEDYDREGRFDDEDHW